MSLRFPMGVATMYKILVKCFVLISLIFIIHSCTPRIIANEGIFTKEKKNNEINNIIKKEVEKKSDPKTINSDQEIVDNSQISSDLDDNNDKRIMSEIEVILPGEHNIEITQNFINSLVLSIHNKNIKNLSLNINTYSHKKNLNEIIDTKIQAGKIFIGPLTSLDTENINKYCSYGAIFFSFASRRQLASDCVYLINFFPEDDLITLFNHFDSNARVALLYPENNYGHYISKIIDNISISSEAILVSKSSYNEDMSNAREAIKRLGRYELRRNELERQKAILQKSDSEFSKKALKKIAKFETIGELDFTHVIIADYNIRLLEIVPLLPFYDIDPNKIQFVGTGVWDDEAFFDEPSLQRAIFSGVSRKKRINFVEEYIHTYNSEPLRTNTMMYDLVALLSYIVGNQHTLKSTFALLNDHQLSFEGIDGKFSFVDNLIKRELNILQIKDGKALLLR